MELAIEARDAERLPKVAQAAHETQSHFRMVVEVFGSHHRHRQDFGGCHFGLVFDGQLKCAFHVRQDDVNGCHESVVHACLRREQGLPDIVPEGKSDRKLAIRVLQIYKLIR
jgi:hypothetical protein